MSLPGSEGVGRQEEEETRVIREEWWGDKDWNALKTNVCIVVHRGCVR